MTEEERLERHEYELGTIIDPFQVPFPWVRRTKPSGEVVYVNQDTKEVKSKKPGEVRTLALGLLLRVGVDVVHVHFFDRDCHTKHLC